MKPLRQLAAVVQAVELAPLSQRVPRLLAPWHTHHPHQGQALVVSAQAALVGLAQQAAQQVAALAATAQNCPRHAQRLQQAVQHSRLPFSLKGQV